MPSAARNWPGYEPPGTRGRHRVLNPVTFAHHSEAAEAAAAALVPVRCPYCGKLACEASEGAKVRVKCVRCGGTFERST